MKYNGFGKFLIHFFSSTSLQVRRKIVHTRIMAQNTWSGPRKCLLGVLTTLNHFWVNGVPKTPKISPEIGIFHVKMKSLITQKRRKIAKNGQHISITTRGRSFRIRHFEFSVTPSSGRNGDDVISGLNKKPYNSKTVLDTQDFVSNTGSCTRAFR